MTDIEKKAEEYAKNFCYTNINECAEDKCKRAYKDGYEQGQKDFENGLTQLPPKTYLQMSNEISELKKKIRRYEEMLDSIFGAGHMVVQHEEKYRKLKGIEE